MNAHDETPQRRVLIADNDANVSAILREFLVRRGLDVDVAPDGRVALDRLEAGGCDLLVCDLDMPVMTGNELLERLRDVADCPPVVVISGYVDHALEQELGAHPAVREVFRKPFDVKAFAAIVAELASAVPASRDGRDPSGGEALLF